MVMTPPTRTITSGSSAYLYDLRLLNPLLITFIANEGNKDGQNVVETTFMDKVTTLREYYKEYLKVEIVEYKDITRRVSTACLLLSLL